MSVEPASYQAYLLRLWRAAPDTVWRASLESVGSHTTHYFVSPEDLLAYLHVQFETPTNTQIIKGENDAKDE